MNEQENKETTASPVDMRFVYMVVGLLILIVLTMAGLWIIERGQKNRLQAKFNESQKQMQKRLRGQEYKTQRLGTMLASQAMASRVQRGELATQEVDWNGKKRTVLLLGGEVGQGFGFQPGDVILVTAPPKTPQTTPPNAPKTTP